MRRLVVLVLFVLLASAGLSAPAAAQAIQSFSPTGGTTLSVSNSSARALFATPGPTALITNTGANTAYLKFGGSTVTATTANWLLGPGCSIAYDVNGQGYVAAITASSTTTLTIITGAGIPTLPQSSCAVTATFTPSGTQNVNITQVGGNAVTTSVPVSGTVTANQGAAAGVAAGWPTINGEPADTTGTFTNATQTTNITTPSVDGYETATITVSGTYATATATFSASDDGGTTYFPLRCSRTDTPVVEVGYTALTNTNRAWFCPIHSFDTLRILSSAVASGTVNVRISISSSPTAAAVTQSVSSDSTIGVEGIDGSTQASAANPFPVTGGSPSSSAAIAIAHGQSTATESGHAAICASACNLYSLTATNLSTTTVLLLMVFNSTTVPADGAVTPDQCLPVFPGPGAIGIGSSGAPPTQYSTGLSVALSSGANCTTKTASANGFFTWGVK